MEHRETEVKHENNKYDISKNESEVKHTDKQSNAKPDEEDKGQDSNLLVLEFVVEKELHLKSNMLLLGGGGNDENNVHMWLE